VKVGVISAMYYFSFSVDHWHIKMVNPRRSLQHAVAMIVPAEMDFKRQDLVADKSENK